MNKQQLANKIWASANKMRSKIEANEYKDYILGFIFYKYLSDKEKDWLKSQDWKDEDIKNDLREDNTKDHDWIQEKLGYFIPYEYLFSTWAENMTNFGVGDVRDALSSFERNLKKTKRRVFNNIFNTLETGLSKLGGTDGEQTKALRRLFKLIKPIPTDNSQGYDVLGFIYEYLISNFAANAGKKAGEFYTPHEVALLMAEIVADHLKDRKEIKIYDPTSGSGSLLINIGQAVAKRIDSKDNIKYYAQELKENTYNLTRMNLVMRDIKPDNIVVRNGDTLEQDWPYFEQNEDGSEIEGTYDYLQVDAVVSNPPYSQPWDSKNKEADKRFKEYGVAPKGKADYAFLLHNLYHIKNDGIVTIILPHGVLFRGNEDEKIRTNLIEKNNIDAIISLPAKIFFGTDISTIIMVLRKNRKDGDDILFVDASKGFVKVGKRNKLRASDIKRIADTVIHRREIPKFSRLVSRQLIRENGYNMYIPRYLDSSEPAETWNVYATMFGGVPDEEIDQLSTYWKAFPTLRNELFCHEDDTPCSRLSVGDFNQAIMQNEDVRLWVVNVQKRLADLPHLLEKEWIDNIEKINLAKEESKVAQEIFRRVDALRLIDMYDAYQILSDCWQGKGDDEDVSSIANDIEMVQTEGWEALRQVDPHMVVVKSNNDEELDPEIQKGWQGHILPFSFVQQFILTNDWNRLQQTRESLSKCEQDIAEKVESFSEDEELSVYLNEGNDDFDMDKIDKTLSQALDQVSTPETDGLNQYLELLTQKPKKDAKLAFISEHKEVDWQKIEVSKDGTYAKGKVQKRLTQVRAEYQFKEGTLEANLQTVCHLIQLEKNTKRDISFNEKDLDEKTRVTIPKLTDSQVRLLLQKKWIEPICTSLNQLPWTIISHLTTRLESLRKKYEYSIVEVEAQITDAGNELVQLIPKLRGTDTDNKALVEIQKVIKGGNPIPIYSLVDKLFPQRGENKPRIRFSEFDGDWIIRPLSDFLKVKVEKNDKDNYDKYDIFSVSGDYGVVNQIAFQGKSFAGASLRGYKITHKGQVIYTKSPLKLQPYGIIKTNRATDGIVSTLYAVYDGVSDVDTDFIQYYFEFDKRLNDYLRPLVNKGAKNTLLISDDGALEGLVCFPPTKEEQTSLAHFFSSMDNYIKASETKITTLKQLRKSLLERMFVDNNND
jgi:type I restriction enzyme M protein